MENVLFIGAHPDDVELGCGGTMAKHTARGDKVFVLILSKGEIGNKKLANCDRTKETIMALCSIGIKGKDITILDVPDTCFDENRKRIFAEIEREVLDKKIDRVYTHTNREYHQDHITVHEETLRAARNVRDLLTYESNAHTFSHFSPNFFIDISDIINKKIELIKKHYSQKGKKYMEAENIKSLAKVRGYQSRVGDYAEGFEIIRMVTR